MEKFEVIPGNPRLQLEYDIARVVETTEYETILLEHNDEQLRISVVHEETGTGQAEHEAILALLQTKIPFLNPENSHVYMHPEVGSYNIIIDCRGLFDSQAE